MSLTARANGNVSSGTTADASMASRPRLGLAVLAILVGLASALLAPVGWDEAFWQAIADMVSGGADLYDGAIDNKTPLVYAAVGLVDWLPGPFVVWRGAVVAGLIWLAGTLWLRLGATPLAAALGMITLALQGWLLLTVELVSVVLLLAALSASRSGRWGPASIAAVVAAGFDPRALLFLPVVVWLAPSRQLRQKSGLVLAVAALAAIGVILAVPDLRFGLIEMNVATRSGAGGWSPGLHLASLTRSLLPMVVLIWLVGSRRPQRWQLAVLGLGLLIGLVSVLPWDHYWGYALLPLPLLASEGPIRFSRFFAAIAIAAGMAGLLFKTADTLADYRMLLDRYEWAVQVKDTVEGEGAPFVVFDLRPHATYLAPDAAVLRSPVIGYLLWTTSRSEAYRAELPALIQTADAIIDDGSLDIAAGLFVEPERGIRWVFEPFLSEFSCITRSDVVVVRTRPPC